MIASLLFTDILEESSEIIVVGYYKEQIASAFGAKLKNKSFKAPGASLEFIPYDQMDEKGYGEYKKYVQ